MYHKLHPEATSVEWSPIPTQIRNFVSAGQAAEGKTTVGFEAKKMLKQMGTVCWVHTSDG